MERVGVLFGGPSPEHDISILTGLLACRGLRTAGFPILGIYWSKQGEFHQVDTSVEPKAFEGGVPSKSVPLVLKVGDGGGFYPVSSGLFSKGKRLEIDVVLNACHGGPGEDGTLQSTLDMAHVRYTGPTARSAALGMDKLAFGGVVAEAGLAHLPRVLLTPTTTAVDFPGPYIIKPRFGGSSIGIDVVDDLETARMRLTSNVHLKAGAVLEPYRRDLHDLQIAVRSWPEIQLSAIERPIRKGSTGVILSYGDKYIAGEGMDTAPRELPAKISESLAKAVAESALIVADLVAVRGAYRIDFLASDEGEFYVNEVNTIPGSLSWYLWVEPKVPFDRQLAGFVEEAIARPSVVNISAGADGSVLKSATSVASKLA